MSVGDAEHIILLDQVKQYSNKCEVALSIMFKNYSIEFLEKVSEMLHYNFVKLKLIFDLKSSKLNRLFGQDIYDKIVNMKTLRKIEVYAPKLNIPLIIKHLCYKNKHKIIPPLEYLFLGSEVLPVIEKDFTSNM